jgi:hypothetical protein
MMPEISVVIARFSVLEFFRVYQYIAQIDKNQESDNE